VRLPAHVRPCARTFAVIHDPGAHDDNDGLIFRFILSFRLAIRDGSFAVACFVRLLFPAFPVFAPANHPCSSLLFPVVFGGFSGFCAGFQ
jgi:hypothetical protein